MKERFAEDAAAILYRAAHHNRFDSLVLVAGPQILDTLCSTLHKEVVSRVVAEVPKTLTNHPVYEIERVLTAVLDA